MVYSITFNNIEDCFYEKRIDISLHENNDHYDRWVSQIDCLDRCLKFQPQRCQSFEHWRSNRHGLCVLANNSLSNHPSLNRPNSFVDYYEIDCRKDTKALRLQTITCPGDRLQVLVTLNGIDPNYIHLGDSECKPEWFNETHAEFHTHVDNCSLILNDGSITGKLRWEGVNKENNEARQYERFFLCPSDIYQIRQANWTLTTNRPLPPNTHVTSTNRHQPSSGYIHNDPTNDKPLYRINLQWILFNRTYVCPNLCSISLFSLIYVKFDELTLPSSTFFIDSCDLIGLYPYSNYFRTRRLISRGCSTDPTIIHLSTDLNSQSIYHYSFYLYNILKEPIPFQIQCKILTKPPQVPTNCSHIQTFDNDEQFIHAKFERKDYSYVIFRSLEINVQRQITFQQNRSFLPNSCNPIFAVQYFQCFLFALSLFIHRTFFLIVCN